MIILEFPKHKAGQLCRNVLPALTFDTFDSFDSFDNKRFESNFIIAIHKDPMACKPRAIQLIFRKPAWGTYFEGEYLGTIIVLWPN
ncbi:hypothetical protein ASC97_30410 [Rhizobium sp. Root1203]|nr:hypothetical protein ASC97_30410 [Rhizobium sp. Root1203]